jgi:pimeloyl-ACP methyl ester carboxylesterase
MGKGWAAFLVGLVMILGGSWLAARIQTDGGITVQDVRFPGASGEMMSGLLYIPRTATPMARAPGVLAVHGYINSRETQDGFAIEFARRGYVVLAMDQTGHGYSGGAAFSSGFGGPAGLRYLRSLPMVDTANIGLEGHSMGGWTILAAAAAMPSDYRAMVLEGSSTGKPFAADGTRTWPRNLEVVFSRYDEFSKIMWGVDRAQDVTRSDKLKAVFGSDRSLVPGRIYGTIADGTARRLETPVTTHPGDHVSTQAIGHALDWFAVTLKPVTPRSNGDQIWYWKEIGTGVALLGFVALILGTFDLLLAMPLFAPLRRPATGQGGGASMGWIATTALVPILTLFPAFIAVTLFVKPSVLLPQTINNQVIAWALVNTALTAVFALRSKAPAGRPVDLVRTALLAGLVTGIGALSLIAVDQLFKVDFRFWVVALKLPDAAQLRIMLSYFPPLLLFFWVSLEALCRRLPGTPAPYATAVAALAGGFALFLALDYGIFFLTGYLPTSFDPLTTVVAIQFLPLMSFVAVLAVLGWKRTGSAAPGALLAALLVTWYVVAGTATHVL